MPTALLVLPNSVSSSKPLTQSSAVASADGGKISLSKATLPSDTDSGVCISVFSSALGIVVPSSAISASLIA